jgi:capsular polysaccharide biosynthesis protein
MPKDSSFRLCILILLIIQTTIWALTLLDLMHPGRPIALVRSTVDMVATLFAKQPSAVLVYRDFRARI